MKNSKGFTLVELIAIIIVLAGIIALTYTSITKVLDRQKKKTFIEIVNGIIDSTSIYATENQYSFKPDGSKIYIDSDTSYYYFDLTANVIPMNKIDQIKSGYVYIGENNVIYVSNISNGMFCAVSGTTDSLVIKSGEC